MLCENNAEVISAYILLLLVDMADLKPNVLFCQGSWWNRNNVSETLDESVAVLKRIVE